MIRELEAGDISLSYEGRSFGNIKPGMAITGQERAMGLLRLGLETDRAGYRDSKWAIAEIPPSAKPSMVFL